MSCEDAIREVQRIIAEPKNEWASELTSLIVDAVESPAINADLRRRMGEVLPLVDLHPTRTLHRNPVVKEFLTNYGLVSQTSLTSMFMAGPVESIKKLIADDNCHTLERLVVDYHLEKWVGCDQQK